jgi:mono/diheme cytochrome c family protein
MKVRPAGFAFLACLLMFASAAASAQTSSGNNLLENPVFKTNCAKCHGKTAEGRHFGGPSLVSDKTKAASDGELREIITNGKGRMPKYAGKLSPEEISTLVGQIRGLNKK